MENLENIIDLNIYHYDLSIKSEINELSIGLYLILVLDKENTLKDTMKNVFSENNLCLWKNIKKGGAYLYLIKIF